ncbi:16121_t:CDS:1 [Funneliformis geosporum]|uniref:18187_t:CDS:1 n=1 Tax=Funneliformis geosporum TaxID=1117311 RepID=A0A9W4SF71_9GLOM|nr:16121_t:CDS:1 [Funneliformis geosporum]CAI2167337.1 18187_t:CDS:1 [Funneliformis geosporum]
MSDDTSSTRNDDMYLHEPDCNIVHPIPNSNDLDLIINKVIDSSNTNITREFIEDTINQPLHALLIPSHKCKSPFVYHQHSNARTLFKQDYINIIHKEISQSQHQKISSSPIEHNSRPNSNNSIKGMYSLTTTSSSKTDQEINMLASLWSGYSAEVRQVYEVLEKCSEKVHEYMFKANQVKKEKERSMNEPNSLCLSKFD